MTEPKAWRSSTLSPPAWNSRPNQEEKMNPKDVLKYAADAKAEFVDLRFTDLLGAWHHLTFPIDELTEDSFTAGFGFDASSLRGWAAINESDMLLIPDTSRFWIDQFMARPTLCIATDVVDPIRRECYWLHPPSLANRPETCPKF